MAAFGCGKVVETVTSRAPDAIVYILYDFLPAYLLRRPKRERYTFLFLLPCILTNHITGKEPESVFEVLFKE